MDEEIRAALRRGDVDGAFLLVQRAYGTAINAICYRILKEASAAEDAMQQTLIAAFGSRTQLLGVDNIRSWLMRTASRKCIDTLRLWQRTGRMQHDVSNGCDGAAVDHGGALALFAAEEVKRELVVCLLALGRDLAALVLMRYHDGMSWEEIAEIVGDPPDAIRMRVNRGALQRIRACLEAKGITL